MMVLPRDVEFCIRQLESAGFRAYVVGGCVRDSLLGLNPQDYDICTNATPEEIRRTFSDFDQVCAGEKHGTIGVVIHHQMYEITTFRTESGYSDSRHPDRVCFVKHLEDDLSRRDFTVNAMAYHPETGYIDPFGGREDLQQGILRCVGNPVVRFTEDALRILRGVRFSARFQLTPDAETLDGMISLAPSLDKLARERVFDELCKLLMWTDAAILLRFAPILIQAIPELAPCIGFSQHSPHHAYDVFTHTAYVVENTPKDLALRWAALLHDIGKVPCFTRDETGRGHFYGHAQKSSAMADAILRRLKSPTALREEVVFLIDFHMTPLEPAETTLRRRLSQWGADRLNALLSLQEADCASKGVAGNPEEFAEIRRLLAKMQAQDLCLHIRDLAIDGQDLLALGFAPGPLMGRCLNRLLELVIGEDLPNEKAPLLEAAAKFYLEATK